MNTTLFLGIVFGLVFLFCIVVLILGFREERRTQAERQALRERLAEIADDN